MIKSMSISKDNKILITGGAGFIGSNLSNYLLAKGWEVTIVDNLSRNGTWENLVWLKNNHRYSKLNVNIIDIRNFNEIKRIISKVNVIYHLAGQVAVTTSFLNPRHDFEVNALGTFNILEAARELGHKPIIIFASTNKVYGQMNGVNVKEGKFRYSYRNFPDGIHEEHHLDFHSPYGCSNGVADQYTRDYYRMYNIPTVVFRQSCIYGPRQMGIEDQGWVAHFAISTVLGKRINIYGDGKQVRDLLHVYDLIEAYQNAVKNIKKSAGQVYNIGGGVEHSFSLLEYLKYLEELSGKKIKTKFDEWRPGDQKVYITNIKKLKNELSWRPKISHKKGLKELFEWVKKNKELFK